MTNRALSLKYPQEMIAFYEKHIKIEEETAWFKWVYFFLFALKQIN